MILLAWVLLVTLGAGTTAVWLVVQRDESVQASAGLSFLFWAVAALGARDLQVASGGSTLDVSSDLLAVTMLVPAVLSVIAIAGARTGHYPPTETDADANRLNT